MLSNLQQIQTEKQRTLSARYFCKMSADDMKVDTDTGTRRIRTLACNTGTTTNMDIYIYINSPYPCLCPLPCPCLYPCPCPSPWPCACHVHVRHVQYISIFIVMYEFFHAYCILRQFRGNDDFQPLCIARKITDNCSG
jgi:hypothetical protein